MLFSSLIFIFFFLPPVILVYYTILRKNRLLQNLFLFLASLFFYAWGEKRFVLIMIASILVNWLVGRLIGRYHTTGHNLKEKIILAFGVLCNLSLIFVYKYLMFTLENIQLLFNMENMVIPVIELPIGISFFTFQSISYLVDVYRQDGRVQKNLINVGLYIAFFPQLIAGPIVRYNTIDQQIMGRKESLDDFSQGVVRFIIGLSKKVLIANNMAVIADFAFGNIGESSVMLSWLGAVAYTFQIYFDFSGYSDMAIGLGKMFGFHFQENFNYPYISKSATEFWRRWHMSLGTWFRDYLYIPLGGNRTKTSARHVFNIFLVWLCTGIWHGANWTFICWGLMYFCLLIFEKYSGYDINDKQKRRHVLKHVYTMFFVVCGWVLFRADSIGDAALYFSHMFGSGVPLINDGFLEYARQGIPYLLLAAFGCTPKPTKLVERYYGNPIISVLGIIFLLSLFLFSVSFIVKDTYNPFIYFNF